MHRSPSKNALQVKIVSFSFPAHEHAQAFFSFHINVSMAAITPKIHNKAYHVIMIP